MTQFTVGCDPEFFVQPWTAPTATKTNSKKSYNAAIEAMLKAGAVKEDTADTIVPICGHLGGTKEVPLQIAEMAPGFKVQEDGIAAEFNIPPCSSAYEFGTALTSALDHIERVMLKPKGFGRNQVNSVTLKPEWIEKFPSINVIGCDPDFCAYETKDGLPVSRTLDTAAIGGIRGAGGHIHLGYPSDMCRPEILAQFLDVVLGLQFLGYDKQGARRPWWGIAGLYRAKPYGMEYRTLSNWWIWKSSWAKLVAGNALALLESISGHVVEWSAVYNAVDWQQVQRLIQTEDVAGAQNLFNRYLKMFPVLNTVVRVGHEKAVWIPPPVVNPVMPRRAPRHAEAMQQPEEFFIAPERDEDNEQVG